MVQQASGRIVCASCHRAIRIEEYEDHLECCRRVGSRGPAGRAARDEWHQVTIEEVLDELGRGRFDAG